MAFVAPFLGPLVSSVGAFVADVGVSVGLSAGISEAVGAAAGGAAASSIAPSLQSGLEKVAFSVFGEEKVRGVETEVSRLSQLSKRVGAAYITQDPGSFGFIPRTKDTKEILKYVDQGKITQSDTSIAPPVRTIGNSVNNSSTPVSTDSYLPSIPGGLDIVNKYTRTEQQAFIEQTQGSENKSAIPSVPIEFSSSDLSKLIFDHTNEMVNGLNPADAIIKVIGTDPKRYALAKVLESFYNKSKKPDLYTQINKVYNGVNLNFPYVKYYLEDGIKVFYWYDEVGTYHQLKENTGIVIPSIYGVFGGLSSPNNNLPIDLADSFFCMHDESYSLEMFSETGDYQLISRLTNNMSRLNPNYTKFYKATIIYFSTVGNTIAKLKGSLPKNVSKEPIAQLTTDDIYAVMKERLTGSPAVQNVETYPMERYLFYKDFEANVMEEHKASPLFQSRKNKGILNTFVQLV